MLAHHPVVFAELHVRLEDRDLHQLAARTGVSAGNRVVALDICSVASVSRKDRLGGRFADRVVDRLGYLGDFTAQIAVLRRECLQFLARIVDEFSVNAYPREFNVRIIAVHLLGPELELLLGDQLHVGRDLRFRHPEIRQHGGKVARLRPHFVLAREHKISLQEIVMAAKILFFFLRQLRRVRDGLAVSEFP